MTWPAVIGLGTVARGGRFVRGGNFNPTNDVATWATQAAGACCAAGGFTAGGDSAGGFDAAGDGAVFGWLADGLTQEAAVGFETSGPFGGSPLPLSCC